MFFLCYPHILAACFVLAHNNKCCSLVKFLCIYFCYFNVLKHVNRCLTTFCFQQLCAIRKISFRWSENKHRTIAKVQMSKIPTVNNTNMFNKSASFERSVKIVDVEINRSDILALLTKLSVDRNQLPFWGFRH